MEKGKNRLRNKSANKEAIVTATKKLIEQFGYSQVTIRQIASKANVSTGLIYKNFPQGKSEIVKDILNENITDVVIPEGFSTVTKESFPQFLAEILQRFIDSHKNNIALNNALEIAYLENPDLRMFFNIIIRTELEQVRLLLSNLQDKGIIDLPKEEHWMGMLIQIIDAAIHRFYTYNIFDVSEEYFKAYLLQMIQKFLRDNNQ